MQKLNLRNVSLIAAVVSCLLQAGAQLFAIVVVVATVTEAPPRSLAMMTGKYAYDSESFWNVMPMVTYVVILLALVANWNTSRRRFIFSAAIVFVVAGLFSTFLMGPVQADVVSAGFRDAVDEHLYARAALWRMLDWMSWTITLIAGLLLTVALVTPVSERSSGQHS